MTNRKNTSRALVASALAVLLCVSMLVGSTFAWFTDNATTSVNEIKAGTLKIELQDADNNSLDGQTLNFKKAEGHENETVLWEPGAKYELQQVKVVNTGNLALKYKLVLTGKTEAADGTTPTANLADVLDVYVGNAADPVGTLSQLMADVDGAAYGIILPAGEADTTIPDAVVGETALMNIALKMQETAGNEYQGLKIADLKFTLYATQYTYEFDSSTDQYDANADYADFAPADQDELDSALAEAKPGDTIDLAGGTYTTNGANSTNPITGVTINGSANTVLDGINGFANCTFNNVTINDIYTLNGNTLNNCTITAPVNDVACATRLLGDTTFVGCTFTANGEGTSLWLDDVTDGMKVTFENCTFVDNIRLGGDETNAYTFKNCKFLGGTVNWSYALVITYAPATFESCTFTVEEPAKYGIRLAQGMSEDAITLKDTVTTIKVP